MDYKLVSFTVAPGTSEADGDERPAAGAATLERQTTVGSQTRTALSPCS